MTPAVASGSIVEGLDDEWVNRQLTQRRALGLADDPSVLAEAAADETQEIAGLVLTDAESAIVMERIEFQQRVLSDVMPLITQMPGYAGAYFDSSRDGGLVIHVLDSDSSLAENVRNAIPPLALPVRVKPVEHTFDEVNEAIRRLTESWTDVLGASDVGFVSIGSDKETLTVIATVTEDDLARVSAVKANLAAVVHPFELHVAIGIPERDAACTDREHCTRCGLARSYARVRPRAHVARCHSMCKLALMSNT